MQILVMNDGSPGVTLTVNRELRGHMVMIAEEVPELPDFPNPLKFFLKF